MGIFLFTIKSQGILAPKGSLMDAILKWFGKPSYELDFESIANIGLVSVVTLILIIGWFVYKEEVGFPFFCSKEFRPIVLHPWYCLFIHPVFYFYHLDKITVKTNLVFY